MKETDNKLVNNNGISDGMVYKRITKCSSQLVCDSEQFLRKRDRLIGSGIQHPIFCKKMGAAHWHVTGSLNNEFGIQIIIVHPKTGLDARGL